MLYKHMEGDEQETRKIMVGHYRMPKTGGGGGGIGDGRK
jgi:hypothetical protein